MWTQSAAFAPTRVALTPTSRKSTMTSSTTSRRAVHTHARLDSGVGCFGSKAGMTQMFTDDGLCVPVTVIGVREGNFVTMVRAIDD